MRWPFACALHELAKRDKRVVLLMGDVGGGLFADFARDYPRRYYNLGTAEQTMVGIAAGMALCGLRPVVYSFTPFLLERAFEQIKLDVDHNRAPVLLVGWEDASQGITHRALDAKKMIEILPGTRGLYPKTKDELENLLSSAVDSPAFLLLRALP